MFFASENQDISLQNDSSRLSSAWTSMEWNDNSNVISLKSSPTETHRERNVYKTQLIANLATSVFRSLGYFNLECEKEDKQIMDVIVSSFDMVFSQLCMDAKNFREDSPHLDDYFCLRKVIGFRKIDISCGS